MTQSHPNKLYVFGKHVVKEALQYAPHTVEKVFIEDGYQEAELAPLIKSAGVASARFPAGKLPKEIEHEVESGAVHQGVIGIITLGNLVKPYKEFAEKMSVTPDTALVLLGEIQDPQNVGAVIRSAAAFGISGVLIPEHNQAQVTGSVVKVSAGMAFRLPLVSVPNVNNSIRDLKGKGFWIYGLEGEAGNLLPKEKFDAPAVFILGNEAKGIREKTRDLCDILLSIPMNEQCESLNAAASAAVALYAWSAQHPGALK